MRRSLMIAAIVAVVVLPSVAAPPKIKAADHAESGVAEKWIAAWNSHDAEKLLPLFTADVFYEDVAFGEANHGSAELRKFAASYFEAVPDLKIELQRSSIHDGHGTIEWTLSGTDKGMYKTGKKFSVRGVSVIEVREGKIFRNLDFYDSATIMRQLGLLPAQQPDSAK